MSKEKEIVWECDSNQKIKEFPINVKINIGGDLRRLQEGKSPLDSKQMKSIASGVYELRDQDADGWYRVIYYTKIKGNIYVLHCFVKKSKKTPKKDLNTSELRLKKLKERIKKGETK